MALPDLAVFTQWVYDISTEVAAQQIDLFNDSSNGAIILRDTAHTGDFNDRAFFAKITDLVRRRNAYGTGSLAQVTLGHKLDTHVRVAAGTFPVRLDNAWWSWIGEDPAAAAAAVGKQMAVDMIRDMLNTGVMAGIAAVAGNSAVTYDETGSSDSIKTMTLAAQNKASALFGDRGGNIKVWIMHSTPMYAFWGNSISGNNGTQFLFRYEDINIVADPWGRRYIVSDIPAMNPGGSKYYTLGLQPGAIMVDRNNDFNANVSELNGQENITRTYQAEWTYNLGVDGYAWNKASGGKSPTDASLGVSTNWTQYATDNKNTAGVLLITN